MIVLDTNVVSELMRPVPCEAVLAWVDRQPAQQIWVTAMTAAELLTGVALLPPGARKQRLASHVRRLLAEVFAGRILSFDQDAAVAYAAVVATRRAVGSPIGAADAIIAASCLAAGAAALATRNTADFAGVGLTVVDPWATTPGT